MNSDDITHEQAKEIADALYPGTNYLVRLKTRMEKKGFPPKDPVYVLVCAAYEAANRLRNEMHYQSCDGVRVGRSGRQKVGLLRMIGDSVKVVSLRLSLGNR